VLATRVEEPAGRQEVSDDFSPPDKVAIAEQHPLGNVFSERDSELVASESYFDVGPVKETSDGTSPAATLVRCPSVRTSVT
jgi:hypothetical protein